MPALPQTFYYREGEALSPPLKFVVPGRDFGWVGEMSWSGSHCSAHVTVANSLLHTSVTKNYIPVSQLQATVFLIECCNTCDPSTIFFPPEQYSSTNKLFPCPFKLLLCSE